MFATRVNSLNDKLTYSERLIANMLFESSKNFEMMTSEQIAKRAGCGQATVIRFSQKLGYPSFKSMMMDIANNSVFHASSALYENESVRDTMLKIKNLFDVSVEAALTSNSDEVIENASLLLEKAGTVFCFGIRNSFSSASLLYYRLLETGRSVLKSDNLLEGVSMARNLSENDVMFVVSASGETEEIVAATQVAHEAGAKIISITGSPDNTVQRLSTIALKSAEYDVHTERFNLVNRASQLYLIDCIFVRLWRRNEEEYIKNCELYAASLKTTTALADDSSFRL